MLTQARSINFFVRTLTLTCLVAGLSSCDFFSKKILAKPVVQVENIKLTARDFSKELANKLKDFDALAAKDPKILAAHRNQIVNDFVISSIVALWFDENKYSITKEQLEAEIKSISGSYPNDSSFRDSLNEAGLTFTEWQGKVEATIKKKKLFEVLKQQTPEPTEAELQSYYNTNKLRYEQKEMVLLSHILVADENQAEIIQKLLKKQKFTEVAQEYSPAYQKDTHDAYGWIEKGYLIDLDKAFKLRVGDVFGPVTLSDGLHIFKIMERRPYKVKTYQEAKAAVVADVGALREKAQFGAWLDIQFKKYTIKKNTAVLESIKVETQ